MKIVHASQGPIRTYEKKLYSTFNVAADIHYTACNNKWLVNRKKKPLDGSSSRHIWNVIHFTKGTKDNYENPSKDSQCPARDLEKGPPN